MFILHGMKDTVVPFNHGVELQSRVNPNFRYKPLYCETADHNDLRKEIGTEDYYASLNEFIDHCTKFDYDA